MTKLTATCVSVVNTSLANIVSTIMVVKPINIVKMAELVLTYNGRIDHLVNAVTATTATAVSMTSAPASMAMNHAVRFRALHLMTFITVCVLIPHMT